MELLSQIFALVIFVGMFIAVISDKWHRYIPALVGAGLTVIVVFLIILRSPQAIVDTLNLGQLTQQASGTGHAFWSLLIRGASSHKVHIRLQEG